MDLKAESLRLDGVMRTVYDGWCSQLDALEKSIKDLSDALASTEKTDLSENATYTITRDERDMKIASKSLLLEKTTAYKEGRNAYNPNGFVQLGATVQLEVVTIDGVPDKRELPPFKMVADALSSGVMGLLSIESPVGKAAIGHKAEDTFEVQVPVGTCIYKIREVY